MVWMTKMADTQGTFPRCKGQFFELRKAPKSIKPNSKAFLHRIPGGIVSNAKAALKLLGKSLNDNVGLYQAWALSWTTATHIKLCKALIWTLEIKPLKKYHQITSNGTVSTHNYQEDPCLCCVMVWMTKWPLGPTTYGHSPRGYSYTNTKVKEDIPHKLPV